MIGEHLKAYKKAYRAKRKADKGFCVKKNRDWRRRWGQFIKYDHDFDGFWLIELIVHKLHIMLDYYEHGRYCMQVDESRLKIVESLKEACRLGDLIMADEFEQPANEVMHAHMKVNLIPQDNGNKLLDLKWDSEEDKAEFDRLSDEGCALREKTIDEFFSYIRAHYAEWWD